MPNSLEFIVVRDSYLHKHHQGMYMAKRTGCLVDFALSSLLLQDQYQKLPRCKPSASVFPL